MNFIYDLERILNFMIMNRTFEIGQLREETVHKQFNFNCFDIFNSDEFFKTSKKYLGFILPKLYELDQFIEYLILTVKIFELFCEFI